MKITVNPPALLPDLVSWLRRNGCFAYEVGVGRCCILYEARHDPREAEVELTFSLRAWEMHHQGRIVQLTV